MGAWMGTEFEMRDADALPEEPRFGDGPLPLELDRFNLGAFLLAPFWTIANGLWRIVGIGLGLFVLNLVCMWFGLVRAPVGVPASRVYVAMIGNGVFALAFGVLSLYVGKRGNRRAWRAETASIATGLPVRVMTVDRFVRKQSTWLRVGVALITLSEVSGLLLPPRRGHWAPQSFWVSEALWWISLAVAVAWWYLDRKRGSPPA